MSLRENEMARNVYKKPWTPEQKQAVLLWGLLLITASCLGVLWPVTSRQLPTIGRTTWQSSDIHDRINPNTAALGSLARLPGIGPARADAILRYRRDWMQKHPACDEPFSVADDLTAVRSIGPKTVDNCREYLEFETP